MLTSVDGIHRPGVAADVRRFVLAVLFSLAAGVGAGARAQVIQASTDFDGRERAPMRLTEARITLGVVKAREGDLEGAVDLGMRALSGDRKSLPSLLMVSRDLTRAKGGLQ